MVAFCMLGLLGLYMIVSPAPIVPSSLGLYIPITVLCTVVYPVAVMWFFVGIGVVVGCVRTSGKGGRRGTYGTGFPKDIPMAWGLFFFLLSIILFILVSDMISVGVVSRVRRYLDSASPQASVFVGGKAIEDGERVLSQLKAIRCMPDHHSHPTSRFSIAIRDQHGILQLELAQDSQYQHEYWVFYPQFRWTTWNEIGRIHTTVFNDIVIRDGN